LRSTLVSTTVRATSFNSKILILVAINSEYPKDESRRSAAKPLEKRDLQGHCNLQWAAISVFQQQYFRIFR